VDTSEWATLQVKALLEFLDEIGRAAQIATELLGLGMALEDVLDEVCAELVDLECRLTLPEGEEFTREVEVVRIARAVVKIEWAFVASCEGGAKDANERR